MVFEVANYDFEHVNRNLFGVEDIPIGLINKSPDRASNHAFAFAE